MQIGYRFQIFNLLYYEMPCSASYALHLLLLLHLLLHHLLLHLLYLLLHLLLHLLLNIWNKSIRSLFLSYGIYRYVRAEKCIITFSKILINIKKIALYQLIFLIFFSLIRLHCYVRTVLMKSSTVYQ